jgi:hypothetical protein
LVGGNKREQKRISLIATSFLVMLAVPSLSFAAVSARYTLDIDPANFVRKIDNQYLPMKPGTVYVYKGTSDAGMMRIVTAITHKTKVIIGVTCVVVKDTVYINGTREEQTLDSYAQDKCGNVWYFGEDSKEYDPATQQIINTEGSWEAGVNGAQPGIVMKAHPKAGDKYRQEYAKGVAEERARAWTWTF